MDERSALPGLTVARANPAVIARFGLPLSLRGVIVTDPGPYGARAGLRRGDAVLAINGRRVARSRDVERALKESGRWLRLDLLRKGQQLSLRLGR